VRSKTATFTHWKNILSLKPKEKDRESLKPFEGKKVAMGIKLKALLCGRGRKKNAINVKVDVIEMLGKEQTASLPVPEWQGVCHFRTRTP